MDSARKASLRAEAKQVSGGLGVLGILWLAGVVWLMPRIDAPSEDLKATEKLRESLATEIYREFPQADMRMSQQTGSNLDLWIAQKQFNSMPYVDRQDFVKKIGKEWCGAVSLWTLPTLTVKELTTGKPLAAYHCLFSRSDMTPDSN